MEWLGFRLHRNPFIIREALDDRISQDLGANVHATRSGKYWTSTDWQRRKQQLSKDDPIKMSSKTEEKAVPVKSKAHWKLFSPPLALAKPLSSIVPENDEMDGSRIETAQCVVLDEEALHGRASGLKIISQYLDDSSRLQVEKIAVAHMKDNGIGTMYEELAALTAQIKYVCDLPFGIFLRADCFTTCLYLRVTQLQCSRCNREKAHTQLAIQDLNYQVRCDGPFTRAVVGCGN